MFDTKELTLHFLKEIYHADTLKAIVITLYYNLKW